MNMKKVGTSSLILFLAVILVAVPFASAGIELSEKAVNPVIVKELSLPASYDITIANDNDYSDSFMIDTLLDINITPKEKTDILSNSEKTVSINLYPSPEMRSIQSGNVAITYYVKGDKSAVKEGTMDLKFVSMANLISIQMPASISKDAENLNVNIKLTEPMTLDSKLTVVSEIGSYTKQLSLTENGADLIIPLKADKPNAGTYEVKFTFEVAGSEYTESKDIVLESVITTQEGKEESGWFLNKEVVMTKENTGNSVTGITISLEKSLVSGLFTTFDTKPTAIKKSGSTVTYEFTKELNPGEKLTVNGKTSYYLPLIILLLVIIAVWLALVVFTPQVKVMKKAVKVRTKTGVFATKIVLSVKNKGSKEVSGLKIIDRMPAFTELVPEKFGTISPSEVRKRTLIWNLDKLASNEEIMLSYIVYSKLTVIGKLDIPTAFATYTDLKGGMHEAHSNKLAVIAPEEPPIQTEIIR
jgi:hypothetical protein